MDIFPVAATHADVHSRFVRFSREMAERIDAGDWLRKSLTVACGHDFSVSGEWRRNFNFTYRRPPGFAQLDCSEVIVNSHSQRPSIAFKNMLLCAGGATEISRWSEPPECVLPILPALTGRETEAPSGAPSRAR